jgi:hypothetical protein
MDPVSLIVSALALGAGAGLRESASVAVKDAYAGLKRLLTSRYHDLDLTSLERRPDSVAKRESLREDLAQAGAAEDGELLEVAQRVIVVVKEQAPEAGSATGIDLERVHAAALRIADVTAGGTGVRIRDAEFSGDIEIQGIRAGTPPPDRP